MAYHERKNLDYDTYKYMQGRKFREKKEQLKIRENTEKRKKKFKQIFTEAKPLLNKGNLLCLGARTGDEVDIAKLMGFNPCIGIDLYPIGKEVIKADWHNMPFDANSFDNVYTNSIDHCYDVTLLAEEIMRVLKQGGKFYFQLERKKEVGGLEDPEEFIQNHANDFLFWDKGEDLANAFIEFGFTLAHKWQNKRWDNFILQK